MDRSRPKVYMTRRLPDEITMRVQEVCDCKWWDEEEMPVPRAVLMEELRDVDGVLSMVTDRIDAAVLDAAPNLRVVSNMAVGYDNISVDEARQRNIVVCNTPDVLTESTADLTFALILATARRIVEAANYLKNDEWSSWSPFLLAGQDVYNQTLGIVGLGRIGRAVARRARGFGMKVLYHNRQRRIVDEGNLGVVYKDLETLLRESDFVCLLTPLTEDTRGFITKKELSLMKPSAILINTSRGSVVDEEALYHALATRQIAAAGLDVFDREPVRANHPLVNLANVVALPHIGSATVATRMKMANLAAGNLLLALTGKEPSYRVC